MSFTSDYQNIEQYKNALNSSLFDKELIAGGYVQKFSIPAKMRLLHDLVKRVTQRQKNSYHRILCFLNYFLSS